MRNPCSGSRPLLPKLRHLLPRGQAHFDRANQLGNIVGMNFFSGARSRRLKNAVKMLRPVALATLPANVRAIPPSAAAPERILPAARANTIRFRQPRSAIDSAGLISASTCRARRAYSPAVMYSAGSTKSKRWCGARRSFRGCGLGRADIKLAVHRDRVAVDDFTAELLRQRQRQRRLPAAPSAQG